MISHMSAAVDIQGLSVTFERGGKSVRALDGLDAVVPEGHVFGVRGRAYRNRYFSRTAKD